MLGALIADGVEGQPHGWAAKFRWRELGTDAVIEDALRYHWGKRSAFEEVKHKNTKGRKEGLAILCAPSCSCIWVMAEFQPDALGFCYASITTTA